MDKKKIISFTQLSLFQFDLDSRYFIESCDDKILLAPELNFR